MGLIDANIDFAENGVGDLIKGITRTSDFIDDTRMTLRQHFDNEFVDFFVVEISDIELIQYPIEEAQTLNYILYGLFAMMAMAVITSLAALAMNKREDSTIDNCAWLTAIIFGLQMFDFFSDINLGFELVFEVMKDPNPLLVISTIGVVMFVILPYAVNLFIATKIKAFVSLNIAAATYFESNSALFISLCIFSGSVYSTLQLMSSRLFDLGMFNSGLTKYELRQNYHLKVFGNVLAENVPQIVFQILYVVYSEGNPSRVAILSMTASILSVIGVLLSWIVQRQSSNCVAVQYHIQMNKKNKKRFSNQDKSKIKKKKERKDALKKELCQALHINDGQSELGYVSMYGLALKYHVVHYVMGNEIADDKVAASPFVKALYAKNESEVNEEFMHHFGIEDLNVDFIAFTKLHRTCPSFTVTSTTQDIELQIQGRLGEVDETDKNAPTALQ